MKIGPVLITVLAFLACSSSVLAQGAARLEVRTPWARATAPGQTGGGAFMELRSSTALEVTGVHSPVSGIAQVHEMVQSGERMSMRPVPVLALQPGVPVQLKPNGMHIMLLDLKRPLVAGEHFPIVLELKAPGGGTSEETVEVEVRALTAAAP